MAKRKAKKSKPKDKLVEFGVWHDSLPELDKMNFSVLLNLSNAFAVIAKLPEGKYRDMAIFAYYMKKLTESEIDGKA